jgi:CDP-diacylglycerol--glycerol-3-phosphate 3-phosphatidyltransferase
VPPRITANQVTFGRLVAIPFLVAALYGGQAARMLALFLGIAVGFTDFVDGWLARKHGPTVLGGLMDPIADKAFVVLVLLVFGDLGWAPWWVVHAVLLREFLVTALRSSFELRRRSLRSTYVAKVKTWLQMFVLAAVAAIALVPHGTMVVVFVTIPTVALVAGLVALARGRFWRGIWIFFGAFAAAAVTLVLAGNAILVTALYVATAALTWFSALDYVVVAARALRPIRAFDLARLAGAAALPVLIVLALPARGATWALLALAATEVAHGGLDNLLAHEGAAAPAWAWSARTLGAAALLGTALALGSDVPILAAFAVSLAGTGAEFWHKRQLYLGPAGLSPRPDSARSASLDTGSRPRP